MVRECDVLIIGAGPGGYVAAIRAAQLGQKVVLTEKERLGGECLNWGCIPSKALIHAGNIIHKIQTATEWGLSYTGTSLDVKKLQAWKQRVVDRLTSGIGQLCRGNGVEIIPGKAIFLSDREVEVQTSTGKEKVSFKHCIIATGGRPLDLSGMSFDHEKIISAKDALELMKVPEKLIIVGGGVTGIELGTFYSKLRTKVVIVEMMDQILPGTDPEAVRLVMRNLTKLGVEVLTGSTVKAWKEDAGKIIAAVKGPMGGAEVTGDHMLVTVGRMANTDGLDIQKTNVTLDAKGQIVVDKQMRTNIPHIFAVGDVTGPPFLAHKASKQGIVAAEVVAGKNSEADFRALPTAIFSDPEIASVGLSEKEAETRGFTPRIGKVPFAAIGRALAGGEPDGFVKIVADQKTKLVLGAVIVGANASDLISEITLAIEMGATTEDIALTVHPHPTYPEGIMEGAEAAMGSAIHIINR